MSLKSTSLNISACVSALTSFRRKGSGLRSALLKYFAVIFVFFVGPQVITAQAQPVFTNVCPTTANVTLPAGGGTITFTTVNIPTLLSVNAIDPDAAETVIYTASPTSISCTDLGGPIPIVVTATDSDGNATCTVSTTILDGGPLAVCMDITVNLDGAGMVTVMPADIDGGSTQCPGGPPPPAMTLSISGGNPTYTCADAGTTFPVTLEATDGSFTSTCVAMVTVADIEDPVITSCSSPVTQTADPGVCNAFVDFSGDLVTATDNCPVTITNDFNAGGADASGTYPVGTTTVTFTASDGSGNTDMCTVMVTITDDEDPVATCSPFSRDTDPGVCEYTTVGTEFDATFTDNCPGGSIAHNYNGGGASLDGEIFPEGATIVTWTATDAAGNTDVCMSTITINDNEDPTISCVSSPQTRDTDMGVCTYTTVGTEFDPTAFADNCPTPTVSNDFNFAASLAGAAFPEGTTTVTWTVTDGSGNTATCMIDVVVEDNEAPVISNCPPISATNPTLDTICAVTNTGTCETTVGWVSPMAVDACNGIASFTTTALDPGGLPITLSMGGTPLTPPCTDITLFAGYYDASLWTSSGPVDISGAPSSVDLSSLFFGMPTTFSRTIEYDGVLSFDWDQSGGFFGFPTFEVALNGVPTTISGLFTSGTVEVVVSAGDLFEFIQNPHGFFPPAITTTVSNFAFTCAEGTFGNFPLGTSTITYEATDNEGNTSTCTFYVQVKDGEAPVAVCQDITVQLDASGNASILATDIDAGSTDNCGIDTRMLSNNTFDCDSVGVRVVELYVTDMAGNADTCTANVTVEDNVNPTALCQSITVQLDAGGNGSVTPAQIDNGSSDACGIMTLEISVSGGGFTTGSVALDCTDEGANNVSLRVTDNNGNVSTCNAVITVEDNIAPTAVCQDITVSLDGTGNVSITAGQIDNGSSDACGIASLSVAPNSFTCSHTGAPQTVTLTVTDNNGNVSTCTAQVTVQDNTNPTAICQNITVQLDATGNVSITGAQINNGSSDICGIASLSASPNTFNCSNVGANAVVLTVTDNNGNTSTCNATVTVQDTQTPTITCPADITANAAGGCDALVTVPAPTVNDNCNTTITNDYNGTSNASDTYSIGTTVVTWTVDDGNGNTSTCTMNVTVQDNENPTIVCPTGATSTPGSITINVTPSLPVIDDCGGGNDNIMATLSSGTLPAGAVIDDINITLDMDHTWVGDLSATLETPDGDMISLFARPGISGAPIDPNDDVYFCSGCCGYNNAASTISLIFADTASNSASALNNFAGPDGDLVGLAYNPLNAFSTLANGTAEGDYIIRVYDGVGSDVGTLEAVTLRLDYSYLVVNNDLDRETDPGQCSFTASGTEFDPLSFGDNCPGATIMHNIPSPAAPSSTTLAGAVFPVGTTNVTWTVTDASGNTTSCIIGILVTDEETPTQTGGQADGTTISVPASGGGCSATVNWTAPTFTDNCSMPVIPSATHTPGSTFPVGTHNVEYVATDPSGNTTIVAFTVIVTDGIAPIAGCQPNPINLVLDATGFVTLTALNVNLGSTDNCGIESYLISIDGGPFATSHTFNCNDLGTYTVTLEVSDGSLTDQCTATVTVSDNVAPVASCQDITVNLDATGNASITASQVDNGSSDNGQACLSLSIDVSTFDCSDIGPNTVTLTALDAGGNSASCTATVTVEDNIAPTISLVNFPPNVTVSCNTTLPGDPGNITATDNCDVPVIVYSTSTTQSGNPANCANYSYTFTQTWTASDNSSNSSSMSRVVTVQDNSAPTNPVYNATVANGSTISTNPNDCFATITLQLTGLTDCAPFANITKTNNAAQGNGTTNASGNYPIGVHSINFTVTDPCGNSNVFNYTFTVVDNSPPTASCVNNLNLGLPSSGILVLSPAAVNSGSFDNCGVIANMTLSRDTFTCADVGLTIPVTLTVTDDAGNSSSCNTSVTIQENNAPTALCQPVTLTLDGNGMASLNASQVNAGSFDDCTAVTLSVSPNSFDETDLGNNTVTLTVMDMNGNTSTCNANVTVVLPPTCFHIGDVAGGAGNVVSVPITVEDFTGLVGFQAMLQISSDLGTMPIDGDSIGEFVGISGIHPDVQNVFQFNLLADTLFTPVDTTYLDELDGMGDPVYPPLDSIDMITYDTTLYYNNLSVSWVDSDPSSAVSLPDGTVLFNADILLTGNLGDASPIIIDPTSALTPLEITQQFGGDLFPGTGCWSPGSVEIGELIISGNIHNESGHNVALVDVNLYRNPFTMAGNFIDDFETTTDGNYSFTVASGGNFDILPVKTINWPNGIDILDVAAIQRHAVNFAYVNSAYKKIAADVSGDASITTFDAVQLNLYLNGGFTGTPPPTPSWQFVDATQVLPNDPNASVPSFDNMLTLLNVISDVPGNDFIAVKTGDIAGNPADTAAIIGNEAEHLGNTDLEFIIDEQSLKAGEVYSIDVRANNFDQLIGYQWVLDFNPEVLSYAGFENGTLTNLGTGNFGEVFVEDGQLILTWYNAYATNAKSDEVLFKLNFVAKKDAQRLSDLLAVAELPQLKAVAYNDGEIARGIDLKFEAEEKVPAEFALYQNTPNPFKDETVISFNLPKSTFATLTIMDITGRVVYVAERTFDQGYNEVNISKSDIPASGTLFYELVTPEHTASKQMIVIE